jgi:hypothetical protein
MAQKCIKAFSQLFVGILKITPLLINFKSPQIEKAFNLRAIQFRDAKIEMHLTDLRGPLSIETLSLSLGVQPEEVTDRSFVKQITHRCKRLLFHKKWETHWEEDGRDNDQLFNCFEPRSAFDR